MVVMPRFGVLFTGSGSALPASTAFVLSFSALLRVYAVPFVFALVMLAAFTIWLATSRDAANIRSRLFLSLPLVSGFYREVLAARTARVIAILLGGGAPFVAPLDAAPQSLAAPSPQ